MIFWDIFFGHLNQMTKSESVAGAAEAARPGHGVVAGGWRGRCSRNFLGVCCMLLFGESVGKL